MNNMIVIHPKCPSCKKLNKAVTFNNVPWTCTECEGCRVLYSWSMMMYKGKVVVYNIVVGFGMDDAG